jgi:Ca2+-binding EF-hand superfamily protein
VEAAAPRPGSAGCLRCHAGIEEPHPLHPLGCVDCHGGDASAGTKERAHVLPSKPLPTDERVVPLDYDLPYRRFRNPTDLRVAARNCGGCHAGEVASFAKSLHATTAGHLSDGLYENGVVADRRARFALFPAADEDGSVPPEGYARLEAIPGFDPRRDLGTLAAHFADVPRKSCAQCHFYSEGRAVRGRLGMDGDYRAEGCAGCHMPYADDGLSRSGDPSVKKHEPGHPIVHRLTLRIPTETCAHCHYGDASIGLHFRGLAQLPPGMPGGPDIPNSTKSPLNGVFYFRDPRTTPPDVHHEKGLACIDCHTVRDTMGDGNLYGFMEHAVEIECADCHGTFSSPSMLATSRGAPLTHLRREGGLTILRSKVTGEDHVVPQARDVLDSAHGDFNASAARAMTPAHARLECYACHAGWNVDFFGFHFDRNETFTQLDLLSGERSPGRCTTQEKVFSTFRRLTLGWSSEGAVAPFLVGFSTMGTVVDASGRRLLDQRMPETRAGRSGMTMIHHDPHSTRPRARACVECHRSSSTFGLGSPDFRLARELLFAADRRGLEVVAFDRRQPAKSLPVAKLPLPDPVAIAPDPDPIQGHARRLFVACRRQGIMEVDLSDPGAPRRAAFLASVDPQGLVLAGSTLLVADGEGGLRLADVSVPGKPKFAGHLPTVDARGVALQWPYAFVADGPGGLLAADVAEAAHPRFLAALDTNGANAAPNDARGVAAFFQPARPNDGKGRRTRARLLVAVAGGTAGSCLVDATEPSAPKRIYPPGLDLPPPKGAAGIAVTFGSQFDLGDPGGAIPTEENDYLYDLIEREGGRSALRIIRISNPERLVVLAERFVPGRVSSIALARVYNAPYVQSFALVSGDRGIVPVDVSRSAQPDVLSPLPGLLRAEASAVEEFAFDRMVDEDGRALKDVSHEGARFFTRGEIAKLLRVPGSELGIRIEPPFTSLPAVRGREALAALDRDRDGRVSRAELPRKGEFDALDGNGDGFVTLREAFAAQGGTDASNRVAEPAAGPPRDGKERGPDPDSVWAKLLDGVPPPRPGQRLSAADVARLLVERLDANGDGGADLNETARLAEARGLAWGGPGTRDLFGKFDRNHDGRMTAYELALPAELLRELDLDRDGAIGAAEFPARRGRVYAIAATMDAGDFLKAFDRDRDGKIEKRELPAREVFESLDADGNGGITGEELAQVFAAIRGAGVDGIPDEFLSRYDLDRDGSLTPVEFPAPEAARARLLRPSGGARAGG